MSESIPGTIRCGICDGEAVLMKMRRPFSIARRRTVVEDEFYRCTVCGEELYLPGQADAVYAQAAARIREREGLLPPERIREIRKRYRLPQRRFEELLGTGKNTVVRWERGTGFQSPAADSLLRLIDARPENVRLLAEMHGVELPG